MCVYSSVFEKKPDYWKCVYSSVIAFINILVIIVHVFLKVYVLSHARGTNLVFFTLVFMQCLDSLGAS